MGKAGRGTSGSEIGESSRAAPGAALVAVAAGGLLACTQLGSLDLPLMLANGDLILADGAIPRTNVFNWVAPEHAYLNDKWGFMVLVALVNRVAGSAGSAALKVAFGALLGGLLFLLARRTWRGPAAAGIAALGLTMLSYRFHLRAELVSYVGLASVLVLLPHVLARRGAALAAVVLLIPPWAACHGYWYLGPLVLLAAGAGARSPVTLATAGAALVAGAASPYGVANVLHPFRVLTQLSGGLGSAITELRVPFVSELSGAAPFTFFHGLALLLAALVPAAVVTRLRQRRAGDAFVLLLLLAVSLRIDRNLAMLGLALPSAAAAFGSGKLARALPWGGLLAPIALLGVAAGVPSVAVDRRLGFGPHDGRFPAELARRLPPGERYVNDLSIGSFLVRSRGTAFIDGNTEGYPPEFLAEYRSMLTGERTLDEVEAAYDPDGYVLRHGARTTRVMILGLFLSGAQAPVDWDGVGTLFGPDLPPEEADARWVTWLRDVYLPVARGWYPAPAEALERARLRTGADEADPRLWRDALVQAPWEPSFYAALARAYRAHGQEAAAARCNRLALRLRSL